MALAVEPDHTGSDYPVGSTVQTGHAGGTGRILIIIAMFLFSLFRFGVPEGASFGTILLFSMAAYLLTIYLFYGISWLAYLRSGYSLWSSLLGAIVVGYLLSGIGELWMLVTTWTMLISASVITGRMNIDRYKQMPIYIGGLIAVSLVGVAQMYPVWTEYVRAISLLAADMTEQLTINLQNAGAEQSLIADNIQYFQKAMDVTVRLLPAALILGIMAQFSVGYLFFLRAVDRRELFIQRLRPMLEWKMPFAMTPLLIVGISMRILGSEEFRVIADNLLAILSVFYCVTGLALVEGILRKIKIPIWMKVLFYLMLFLTHVIGYIVTVMLGFVDSFADWRKVQNRPIV
ncbi:MAG: DUF2232 domain-containing protein [bacterium]|nr:DUF2232 domain-containing protein [bacterium]